MPVTTGNNAGVETTTVQVSIAPETIWGQEPTGSFQALRMQSEGLRGQKSRSRPQEINDDRAASDEVTQSISASGPLGFALSFKTYDMLFPMVLGSDWSQELAINSAGGDITFTQGTNKMTSTTAGKFADIAEGQNIRVHGGSPALNGIYRVAKKTSAVDVTLGDKAVPATETPAGTACRIRGSYVFNGPDFMAAFMQKRLGSGNKWLRYPGAFLGSLECSGRTGAFFGGTANFMMKGEKKATTAAGNGTILPPPRGGVMDTVNGFRSLRIDGDLLDTVVTELGFTLTNEGAGADYGMGSPDAQGMRGGTFMPSGRIGALFRDFTLWDRYDTEQEARVSWEAWDKAGNCYLFTFLRAALMNPGINASGPNASVPQVFDLAGQRVEGGSRMFQVDRFAAAA